MHQYAQLFLSGKPVITTWHNLYNLFEESMHLLILSINPVQDKLHVTSLLTLVSLNHPLNKYFLNFILLKDF